MHCELCEPCRPPRRCRVGTAGGACTAWWRILVPSSLRSSQPRRLHTARHRLASPVMAALRPYLSTSSPIVARDTEIANLFAETRINTRTPCVHCDLHPCPRRNTWKRTTTSSASMFCTSRQQQVVWSLTSSFPRIRHSPYQLPRASHPIAALPAPAPQDSGPKPRISRFVFRTSSPVPPAAR